jgi:hypothetical protein
LFVENYRVDAKGLIMVLGIVTMDVLALQVKIVEHMMVNQHGYKSGIRMVNLVKVNGVRRE